MSWTDAVERGELPERVRMIADFGVTVTHEDEWEGTPGIDRTRYVLLDTIRGVHLPLSAEDWLKIATREGPAYVGGCCGNMSAVQDTVNSIFRDGGYAEAPALLSIGEAVRDHDGDESPFQPLDDAAFEERVEAWKKAAADPDQADRIDPWFKLGMVFNAVEPLLEPRSYEVPSDRGRHNEEQHLISTLHVTLARMSWTDLFTRDDPDDHAQHEANMAVMRAKVYPLVKELARLLETAGVDFTGYAIVDPETGETQSDYRGLCIYPERAQAERVLELWQRWAEDEAKRLRERDGEEAEEAFWTNRKGRIVPATVTLDGLNTEQ
jgi:hypothetical protein